MRGDGWRRACCLVLGGNIPSGLTVFLSSGCWFLGASTHGVSQVSGWWSFMVSPVLQGVVVTKQFKRSLSISTGGGGEKGSQASTLPQSWVDISWEPISPGRTFLSFLRNQNHHRITEHYGLKGP